jgi:hypothetical protein
MIKLQLRLEFVLDLGLLRLPLGPWVKFRARYRVSVKVSAIGLRLGLGLG